MFFSFATSLKSQVANDECAGAIDLGSLNVPAACPSGVGAQSVFNLSNTGAVEEYIWQPFLGCQPSGSDVITPTADVWYSFVNQGLNLNLTLNGAIQNPGVVLYEDGCNTIRSCALGSNGSVTLNQSQLNPGQTYYLQIFGATASEQGDFTLTMSNTNGCDECLIASNLTANPPPINGRYAGGQTVTFCYTITEWNMVNTNWLHGVVPVFGNGWDLTTLVPNPPPDCDGLGGSWDWYSNINTTTPFNGGYGIMTGFFFDGNPGPDGNPINNYGDRCGTPEPGDPLGPANSPNWEFCWTITTRDCNSGQTNDNLGITINTFGDGQTGDWDDLGCNSDPLYSFAAVLNCCTPPLLQQTDNLCFGAANGSATATGQGTGPFNYVWKDNSNAVIQTTNNIAGSDVVNGLAAGNYTVTVTDIDNGCVQSASFTITEPLQLQLLVGSTDEICSQTNGTATVTPQGGTPNYNFIWTDENGSPLQTINNLPGSNTLSGLAEGIYGVEVTDQNGCSDDLLVNIQNQTASLVAAASSSNISCFGLCDGSATITLNGGAAPYDFVWTNAQNVTVHTDNNLNTPSTASGLCAGSYTVSFNDANNCQGSVTVVLTEPSEIIATATSQTICFGETADITVDVGGGSGSGYTFTWLPAGTGNTQTISVSPQQTTQYSVTITDGSSCTEGPINVTVTVSPPLLVTANANPSSICFGESTQISVAINGGVAPFNYAWQPAGSATNQSSFAATPNATTLYSVEVTDACSNVPVTEEVTVTVNNLPNILISASPQQGCQPLSVAFTNNTANAINCLWDFGNGQTSADCGPSIVQLYPDTGCFNINLEVTDANGCINTAEFENYICVQEAPTAAFSATPQPTDLFSPEIFFTDLSETEADSWLWDFDGLGFSNQQNPSFAFPDTGCYEVLLTINTPANCPASDTQLVCINPPYAVYFPNSFSPNEDGVNDVFSAKGEGILNFELWIYDRWGELVFFTNSINNTWDGQKIKGNAVCQDDVYAWRANVVDITYRQYTYRSRVTLLR